MRKIGSLIKCTVFLLLLCLVLRGVTGILVPKNYTGEWSSPVPTYSGFYNMEKNTVDVVFLGSSHAYASFCPQVLYDNYGITSYNLGMGNQNILLNYFWLKEALKTQSPKAVVLEGIFLFPRVDEPANTTEAALQKSLSYMKWSSNRINAIKAICKADSGQKFADYIPNIRFHDRWKELHEEDFSAGDIESRNELKGYSSGFYGYCEYKQYKPYGLQEDSCEEMLPVMKEYLDKIAELCREKNIELILTLTPSAGASPKRHNTLRKYSEEKEILFYDFNTKDAFSEMNYNFQTDNSDTEHPNVWGAAKITDKIGQILKETLGLPAHEDTQWSSTSDFYKDKLYDAGISHIDDIYDYLDAIDNDRYTVFMSVKDDSSYSMNETIVNAMSKLGLRTDLRGRFRESYYAVIEEGNVLYEQCADGPLEYVGSIRKGRTMFKIISEGSAVGNSSSICIEGRELSVNSRGLNIVVIDNESCSVIDSVCFDTCDGLAAVRE